MSNIAKIHLEFLLGTTIEKAAREATDLFYSCKGVKISYTFNGVTIEAGPSIEDQLDEYWKVKQ